MTPAEYLIFALFIFLGIVSIVSAALNSAWFFSTSAARSIVSRIGLPATRLFYALLGLALIACGTIAIICWRV